jgi:DUF177 domain-containing protein
VLIDVESLRDEPLHVHHVYAPGTLKFENEQATLTGPVEITFVLTHKERDLRLSGSVKTDLAVRCSRCLRDSAQPVDTTYDLHYAPHPRSTSSGEEIELKYDDMAVGFYDGLVFDVDIMVAEQITMALPMKVVCREDCAGLCATCGRDLNEGPCGCTPGPVDSRMATLLDFRKKMKS